MPADHDVIAAITSHLDERLLEQDKMRAAEFKAVYSRIEEERDALMTRIDDSSEKKRDLIERYARDTTAAIQAMAVQVGSLATEVRMQGTCTDKRIKAIEDAAIVADQRKDGWWKTAAAIVFGGGGLATFLEWVRNGGGKP